MDIHGLIGNRLIWDIEGNFSQWEIKLKPINFSKEGNATQGRSLFMFSLHGNRANWIRTNSRKDRSLSQLSMDIRKLKDAWVSGVVTRKIDWCIDKGLRHPNETR